MSAVADEGRGNAWVATPVRGDQDPPALRAELARIDAEAARDQRERNDPGTRGMVEARDFQAAGGRFDDADSTQRLIDATRQRNETVRAADAANARAGESLWRSGRAIEHAERRGREDRETGPDADWATRTAEKGRQFAHPIELPPPDRTPGDAATDRTHSRASGVDWTPTRDWDGRPDRGEGRTRDRAKRDADERAQQAKARDDTEARRRVTDTLRAPQGADHRHFQDGRRASDTPAADRRARDGANDRPHRMQGQTRDRAHWHGDRPGASYADRMVGRTRGRGEEQQR